MSQFLSSSFRPPPYHQIVNMICALQAKGVPQSDYQTLTVSGSEHSFHNWGAYDPATGQTVGEDVIDFLNAHLQ